MFETRWRRAAAVDDQPPPMAKRALTVQEAADLVGVSRRAMYRAYQAGELTVVRISERTIRVLPRDLDAWLERCRSTA